MPDRVSTRPDLVVVTLAETARPVVRLGAVTTPDKVVVVVLLFRRPVSVPHRTRDSLTRDADRGTSKRDNQD